MMLFLMSLTGCSAVKTQYVACPIPEVPKKPAMLPVKFEKCPPNYCLDRENAVNLLTNIELMKSYTNDLLLILQQIQETCNAGK